MQMMRRLLLFCALAFVLALTANAGRFPFNESRCSEKELLQARFEYALARGLFSFVDHFGHSRLLDELLSRIIDFLCALEGYDNRENCDLRKIAMDFANYDSGVSGGIGA